MVAVVVNKTLYIMEQPKGRTHMSEAEKSIIREYRSKGYSLSQIARFVKRSSTSVGGVNSPDNTYCIRRRE